MQDTPDIAGIAALIGDRARAAILTSLMDGRALTATELARVANITKQTASAHLSRLLSARLVAVEVQGRHHYFRLAGHDVGTVLEKLMGVAARLGAVQVETGPAEPAMKRARVCYDHLAGELGVLVFDSLTRQKLLRREARKLKLTDGGLRLFGEMGIDLGSLPNRRRPLCLACLDWSMRRHHLAGALGAALLDRCFELKWARRARDSRAVLFSALGEKALRERFTLHSIIQS